MGVPPMGLLREHGRDARATDARLTNNRKLL